MAPLGSRGRGEAGSRMRIDDSVSLDRMDRMEASSAMELPKARLVPQCIDARLQVN
jgi:hypothetical protein